MVTECVRGSRTATMPPAMPTIPQKELRNNVGDVLRRAEAGEEFTITVAGRPVAQLGPAQRSKHGCIQDLITAGC